MNNYIWIHGTKYYYYAGYRTWEEAYKMAKWHKRKVPKCKYFIFKKEQGLFAPYFTFKLYLSKVIALGGFR